jgi:hypothetical protein
MNDPSLKKSTKQFLADFISFKNEWENDVSCMSTTTADTKPKVMKPRPLPNVVLERPSKLTSANLKKMEQLHKKE